MDSSAFHSLSYGLYLISTQRDGKPVGCVVNTFAQVTSSPAQVSVAVNKDNYTAEGIRETGLFEAVVLDESAPMELIGTFGFHSSQNTDKFADFPTKTSAAGIPYVYKHSAARFSVKVVASYDIGSHILFIGEVTDCAPIEGGKAPMTYAYYHQVKGGKTPPKASSYNPADDDAKAQVGSVAWRCTVCGHIEYVEELPDDYVCPVCGVGKEMFEKITV